MKATKSRPRTRIIRTIRSRGADQMRGGAFPGPGHAGRAQALGGGERARAATSPRSITEAAR